MLQAARAQLFRQYCTLFMVLRTQDSVKHRMSTKAYAIKFSAQLSLLVCLLVNSMNSLAFDGVRVIAPAELGFFDKVADYKGILIKANRCVDDRALSAAHERLDMMLKNAPEIALNLKDSCCELHIIGSQQQPSDLPELRHWKGKPFEGAKTIDERTRGVGGRLASCGEENLLHLKGDRYFDRDICVHEFAHTLMEFGLDSELRKHIKAQYQRSKKAGLWPGCYALNNEGEFWAELSMWYFGSRGDFGKINPPPEEGNAWLSKYDAGAFKLLDDIYSGRLKPQRQTAETLTEIAISQESKLKSKDATVPVKIRFLNLTDKTLKLFWLDYEGKRKFYSEVQAFGEAEQSTYATHPWLVTDGLNSPIAIYFSSGKNGIARIGEHKQ